MQKDTNATQTPRSAHRVVKRRLLVKSHDDVSLGVPALVQVSGLRGFVPTTRERTPLFCHRKCPSPQLPLRSRSACVPSLRPLLSSRSLVFVNVTELSRMCRRKVSSGRHVIIPPGNTPVLLFCRAPGDEWRCFSFITVHKMSHRRGVQQITGSVGSLRAQSPEPAGDD